MAFTDRIRPLKFDEAAYFYTSDERVTVHTFSGEVLAMDKTLETLSGIKHLKLYPDHDGRVRTVTVDMGIPTGLRPVKPGKGMPYKNGLAVSMGNPHLVIFVDDVAGIDLPQAGAMLEHHPSFPDGVNVEFAQVLTPERIRMRVWERGSGITMACGTGACATAAAAAFTARCKRTCEVVMDGGTLQLEWRETDNHLLMTGPAEDVFEGEIDTEAIQTT